jgi:hypothetical protein
MTRYLSGLCVAGLGLCGGGWLIVATAAFGVAGGGSAGKVNLATGAGLILASCVAIVAWAAAWRRRMRTDGVLGRRFLLVTRREARRNRRDLARDVRRATRLAQRAARQARRGARGPAGLAGGEVHGGHSASGAASASGATGHAFSGHSFNGHASNAHAPSTAAWSAAGPDGAGLAGAGLNGYSGHHGSAHRGGGHDGASAADVLGELRTLRALLGPLVATAHAPVLQARAQPRPAARPPQAAPRLPQAAPAPAPLERARREAGLLAGDDALLRLADSEEAWW